MRDVLPWRSDGDAAARPAHVPLPPGRMPLLRDGRPLKRWRWVGAFDDRLMLCVAIARVAGLAQAWWAVWDREQDTLHERTVRGRTGPVRLAAGRARVAERRLAIDLRLDEGPGVESVCPHGGGHVWTRKQAAVPARGAVRIGTRALAFEGLAVVDDTAGYHARDTAWRWAAGAGRTRDGRIAGFNLVEGVNDPPAGSERTVWLDGAPAEAPPVRISPELDAVRFASGEELRFASEAVRERHDRMPGVRSDYRQPFGRFAGTLPGGIELAEGLGVTEDHRARW